MKIFVFSPTSTVFSLTKEQPLGGADSVLLNMISELARHHEVEAYIPVKTEGRYEGANIFPFMTLFDEPKSCDVIIHYRKVFPIPNTLKHKKSIFYSQDTVDTPCFEGLKGNRNVLNQYHKIWVLSRFHKENIKTMFDVPDDKIFIIGNYAPEMPVVEKKELQFIYASTPFRGLDVLLKAWQSIVERYPSAVLHIYSSMKIYGAEQLDDLHFGRMFRDMKSGRFKNLVFYGSVPQAEMLETMNSSFMLLYPNTYPETYCNVIMESRACRTPFITSDLGALKETGGLGGLFIKGNARSPEYLAEFLDKVYAAIEYPTLYKTMQENCYPIRTKEDYAKDLLNEIKTVMD
jgi:glycosyltransferase involved in cell wall biosynthesis